MDGLAVHLLVKNLHSLGSALGPIKGHGRISQYLLGSLVLSSTDSNAHAGCDEHFVTLQVKRYVQGMLNATREADGIVGMPYFFHQDDEFITHEAGQSVLVAYLSREPLSHLTEQVVASLLTQSIVDATKIVDIEVQDSDGARIVAA